MRRIHFTIGLGGRVPSLTMPLPLTSTSRFPTLLEATVLAASRSPGRTRPRRMTVSCWLFMVIWHSASTTRVPAGRTAATRPVSVVLNEVWEVACPFPDSAWAEVGENRLATPAVLSFPGRAVIPELAEKVRLVATAPVLEADKFCTTLIVTRSPTREAL